MVDDLSLSILMTNGIVYFQGGMIEMECIITCSNLILAKEKSCCMCNPKEGISLGLLVNFVANCWLKTEIYVGLYFGFYLSS